MSAKSGEGVKLRQGQQQFVWVWPQFTTKDKSSVLLVFFYFLSLQYHTNVKRCFSQCLELRQSWKWREIDEVWWQDDCVLSSSQPRRDEWRPLGEQVSKYYEGHANCSFMKYVATKACIQTLWIRFGRLIKPNASEQLGPFFIPVLRIQWVLLNVFFLPVRIERSAISENGSPCV